jgi:DNA-nicking Smr family endonuclease
MSRRKDDEGSGGRRLRHDEDALWTGVIRSVKPLRRAAAKKNVREPVRVKTAGVAVDSTPVPRPLVRAPAAVPPRAPKSPLPLAPISRRTKQKLARGTEAIDGRIDLHGLTQAEAYDALMQFLRHAQAVGMKFVLVITGKGRVRFDATREVGVLRREVPRWLKLKDFRDYVVGYESAHVGHGGEGALYVRLRRPRH